MKTPSWSALAALAALLPAGTSVHAAGQGQPPQLTPIGQLVVYAVDAGSYELLRYNFDTDAYVRVGVVTDQNGNVVTDIEGLAIIPHGPNKGLYGTANFYGILPARLVMINPIDATARVHSNSIGYGSVEGLVAAQDPDTMDWGLIGASSTERLIMINPATGSGSALMETEERYRGLAMAPDGTLYGVAEDELYTINLDTGQEKEVGELADHAQYGALEYAFGDFESRVKVTSSGQAVVPDSWTNDGIMFAFDTRRNKLQIVNPWNGSHVNWNCTLQNVDCEGLAFTTRLQDPYESIIGGAVD